MRNIRRMPAVLSCIATLALFAAVFAVPMTAFAGDVLNPPKTPGLSPTPPRPPVHAPADTTVVVEIDTAGPALTTDKAGYLPGETVVLIGSGFGENEIVELKIKLDDGSYVSTESVITGGIGEFETMWELPAEYPLGKELISEADGVSSGLKAQASFFTGSSVLKWRTLLPDSVCPDGYFQVCLCLTQACGATSQPLAGREVVLSVVAGTCLDYDQIMSTVTLTTDANGQACTWITAPSTAGQYILQAYYNGEAAPAPCPMPGNNACDPNAPAEADRCVAINYSSVCRELLVTESPNHPPTINFGPNLSVDMCVPAEICITYNLSDPEGIGGLYEENLSGFGEFRDQINGIYFTPTVSGAYKLIVKTTDPCGLFDIDTIVITVDMNDPPSIAFGNDLSITDCTPGEICLPYITSDPDGLAGSHESLVSGPGTIDVAANTVCFTPGVGGLYTFVVRIIDTCSIEDYDTINVNVQLPNPPSIAFGPDTTITLCQPGPICLPYVVSDPDGLAGLIETEVSGPGTIDTLNNRVCVDVAVSGSFTIIASVTDSCGGSDQDTINVNVTVGAPPTIAFGADFGTGGCTPVPICVTYTVSDPQGLAGLSEALVSGPAGAAIDTVLNRICFTPASSGVYTVIAKVTDPCGAEDLDTIRVTVNLNLPPVLTFGPDTSVVLCSLSQVCVAYGVSDLNGPAGLIETLVSGPAGAIFNAAANSVCFTPTGEGDYTVIVKVKDPCNAEDQDTIVVHVGLNDPPVVTVPNDTTFFLCEADTICLGLFAATDPNSYIANISTSIGWLLDGQVCFVADTSGDYTIVYCAVDPCVASDCDTVVVHVTINTTPTCNVPADTAVIACFPAPLCLPVSATDIDGNLDDCVIVSGPGSLGDGLWCYTPADDESFEVVIRCTDSCGAFCEDSFSVSFDLNEPPICEFVPPSPPLCLPDTAFFAFAVTDPEGALDTIKITSGPGWLVGSTWFYEPSPGEHVEVTICGYDACGDSCCISFVIDYPVPQPPVCQIPSFDTTFSFCTPAEVCIPISATSPNPPVVCSLVAGVGTIVNGVWCYTPAGAEVDTVHVRCTDICGEFCEDSFIVRFELNSPPTVVLPADSSLEYCLSNFFPFEGASTCTTFANPARADFGETHCWQYFGVSSSCTLFADFYGIDSLVCHPTPVAGACLQYETYDLDGLGGAEETLIDGPFISTIDTANNTICFVATNGPGTYILVVGLTDSCGAADADTMVVTITPSTPPICNLPGNTIVHLCGSQQICLPVSATADDVPVNCVVTDGVGAVIDGNWCYTPTGPGIYNVTITCTDACGATCSGSFQVDVRFNGPPTLTFGPDTSLFQCAPTLVCLNYTVTDPDIPAKWTESIISAPPGALLDTVLNRICFTPPGAGTHTIIVRATDSCGAFDQDTINVNVNLNDPPVIAFGIDTTISQCTPAQICLPYTISDPDGLAGLIETKLAGPAGLDTLNNRFCFTPTESGVVTLIVRVADPCGLFDQDTINITVNLNRPPTCNLPNDTTIFQCAPAPVCLPVSAVDLDGNLVACTLTAGPGTLAEGQWCYTPTGDQAVTVAVHCFDACGASCAGEFTVTFVINDPPVCNVPNDTTVTFLCSLATISLPVGATDPNGNLKQCTIVSGPGELNNGTWSYTPTGPGQYCVTVECRDSCDAVCQESFCVTVDLLTEDCNCIFKVSIGGGTPTDGLNGQQVVVPIVLEMADVAMGGFDLILCYDATAIDLLNIASGPSLAAWEYFTYRLGAYGNCTGNCPSGIVRLIGITDMNNGHPVTDPNAWKPLGTIVNLKFVLTSDRNFIGQCIPIRWCWYQCGDNSISSRTGDTTFLEQYFDFDSCQSNPKGDPIPGICFEDGRICILEPPDDRGDINLNGIANEIGDVVLYTNYFIYGNSVWDPVWKDVQWLASDINDDGIILTIADLIYLIRIITGDEQPFPPGGNPKLISAEPAEIRTDVVGEALALRWNSELAIGGAHFIIDLPSDASVGEVTLAPEIDNMTLRVNRIGNQLRVLVFSDTTEIIPAGSHSIVSIAMNHADRAVISTHDLSTEDGWIMPSMLGVAKALVPTEFSLAQNYPNPFNAGTIIRFGTNEATDYTVAIYDILGRRVWGTSGHTEAGWTEVPWDGRGEDGNSLASGLYLYRVQTVNATQTRKMTLLK